MNLTNILWGKYEGAAGNQGYVYTKSTNPQLNNIYMLYFHGINGDATRAITRMDKIGCHKFFIEYPGYSFISRSANLTTITLDEDMDTILKEIFEQIPSKATIIMYGRSIGTGVMCPKIEPYTQRIQGIILETPFISLPELIRTYVGFIGVAVGNWFEIDKWDLSTLDHIKNTTTKVLILGCGQDYVTPISHSHLLFGNLRSSPDIQLTILENESHQLKFQKIEEDVMEWLTTKF